MCKDLSVIKGFLKDSPEMKFIFNSKGNCIFMSDIALNFLNYNKDDVEKLEILKIIHEEDMYLVELALSKDKSDTYNLRVLDRQQNIKTVIASGYNFKIEDESFRISTMHDITDKVLHITELEEKLEKLNKFLAEQSSNLRSVAMRDLLVVLSHQWRQPLSYITTLATGLLAKFEYGIDVSKSDLIEDLSNISLSINNFSDIIGSFNKLYETSGNKELLSLADIFYEAFPLIEPLYKKENISYSIDIRDSNTKIVTYKNDIYQVISNILKNAYDILKLNNIEKPHVSINISKNIIKIEDNGGGIDKDIKDKIFDPYFTTKHEAQGVGLSLYHAKEIIQNKCGGKIYAMNIGEKARFTIILPE